MSRKPSKPETRIEDYLDVMTGGSAALPQPILRIEFYYAFLAGMAVELPQPILDDEKLLAKICGMEVEAPTYIPGISPRLYAYMAKKGGQDVQVPDPILRLECYWYDYSAGEAPSVQEYTGAVPVTFIADGTPLLDLLISGNEEHSGTPTPDNPIIPQGTGERTAQLIDYPYYTADGLLTGVTWDTTIHSIKASGITLGGTNFYLFRNKLIKAGTYRITINGTHKGMSLLFRDITTSTMIANLNSTTDTATFTLESDMSTCFLYFNQGSANVSVDIDCTIMLNTGSTPLPYEPYGYKIPISSANTTTPVYLGEVETTRKIRKLVLTGEETSWYTSNGFIYNDVIRPDYLRSAAKTISCSHYKAIGGVGSGADVSNGQCALYRFTSVQQLYVRDNSFATVEEWKAYLAAQYAAGTPVTVWYVLAEPETGIVNEPLMKIGDYADTLSMEQAGAQIPTANGSTTLDVETTVPPSEVYIKYRGEAVATLSALPAEVSSPEATEEVNPEETEEEENER